MALPQQIIRSLRAAQAAAERLIAVVWGEASGPGTPGPDDPALTRPESPYHKGNGPGVVESVFWIAAIQFAQILGAIGGSAIFVAAYWWQGGDASDWLQLLELLEPELLTLLACGQVTVVALSLWAVRLRIGRAGFANLGWSLPRPVPLLLGIAAVLPLWLLASALQSIAFQFAPPARESLSAVLSGLARGPITVLILALAITPALAEEILFRGMIGASLVRRWGVVGGMLATSTLFGLAHANFGQSIGVIPIGLALHFIYVTTRSIWTPILLHALNNSIAVALLAGVRPSVSSSLIEQGGPGVPLLVVSAAVLFVIGVLLHELRRADSIGLSPTSRHGRLLYAGFLVNFGGFVTLLVRDLGP